MDSLAVTDQNGVMSRATLMTITSATLHSTERPGFVFADYEAPQARVTDLGLTRGDGVFETIGVIDGHPQALEAHLRRLAHSAALLDLPEPNTDVWRDAILAGIMDYARRNGSEHEVYAKVIYTRGVEGVSASSGWVVVDRGEDFTSARAGIRVVTLDRGYRHDVAQTSPWLLAGAKSLSYAINRAALREAGRRGADDVIFISSDGYVLEGPTSSVLILTDQGVVTPKTTLGILAGTTQESAFAFFQERGYRTEYREIMAPELHEARALWLVSSVRQAAPVIALDDTHLSPDRELTAALNDDLLTPEH